MKKTMASLSMLAVATLASFPALAATGTITKTSTAPVISIYSQGTAPVAITFFNLLSSDFKNGTLTKTKKLTQVSYNLTSYPAAYTEDIQLCYYRPYSATAAKCIAVTPGSSSSTTEFNSFPFDAGAQIQARRTVTGAPGNQLRPAQQETVTYEFSY